MDAQSRQLLFMTEGRKADTVREFAAALRAHGGDPEAIEWVGLDMSGAYAAGASAHLPNAKLAFDHFHIAALAGKALDQVRRDIQRGDAGIKGARWAILGNSWTRSEEQAAVRRAVCAQYPKLGRALGLRESLQDVLAGRDEESLRWWCGWAARSRLGPFQRLARTLKKHWAGILGFFESGITSAAIEAINGKVQLAKRLARGLPAPSGAALRAAFGRLSRSARIRNFTFLRAISYLKAAKLDLKLPSLRPT